GASAGAVVAVDGLQAVPANDGAPSASQPGESARPYTELARHMTVQAHVQVTGAELVGGVHEPAERAFYGTNGQPGEADHQCGRDGKYDDQDRSHARLLVLERARDPLRAVHLAAIDRAHLGAYTRPGRHRRFGQPACGRGVAPAVSSLYLPVLTDKRGVRLLDLAEAGAQLLRELGQGRVTALDIGDDTVERIEARKAGAVAGLE